MLQDFSLTLNRLADRVFLIPIGFDSVSVYPQDEESINLRTKPHLESPPNPAVAMETASII